MDDALKARLIGATILVALAVLLIPELLSDRKPAELAAGTAKDTRGTRTFTIELGGPAQGAGATQPAPSEAAPPELKPAKTPGPTPAPVPSPTEAAPQGEGTPAAPASQPKTPSPATDQAVAVREATPAPTPVPTTTAPASPARGGWAVQVGAFSSSDTAGKLVKKLEASGYTAYVSPITRQGKSLYRVRVGPKADRPAAEALVGGLKAKGLPATVVAND